MGETVPEVLSLAVSPNTDRPRPVNNIFIFSYRESFRKSFLHSPTYVCEVGDVHVDEARDRLKTKTKHFNMIFSSVILY